MAWGSSKVFVYYVRDTLARTSLMDIDTDAYKVALFDNTITPDNTVVAASTAYNAGIWLATAAPQVFQAGQWATGGVALSTPTWTVSSATVTFDGVDTASGSAFTTTTATYGALVYDDTIASPVAKQGVCYNYFGGPNSVTAGTLTVVWNASGIAAFVC
jgi:hypothetical protein